MRFSHLHASGFSLLIKTLGGEKNPRSLWRTIIIQKSGAGVAASLKNAENSSFISSLINLTLERGERTSLKDSDSKYPCFALFPDLIQHEKANTEHNKDLNFAKVRIVCKNLRRVTNGVVTKTKHLNLSDSFGKEEILCIL